MSLVKSHVILMTHWQVVCDCVYLTVGVFVCDGYSVCVFVIMVKMSSRNLLVMLSIHVLIQTDLETLQMLMVSENFAQHDGRQL